MRQRTLYAVVVVLVAFSVVTAIGMEVTRTAQPGGTAKADSSLQVTDLQVDGDETTVNDSVTSFTIDVSGTTEWENLDGSGGQVYLLIEGPDGEFHVSNAGGDSFGSTAESGSADFEVYADVFRETPWTAEHFAPDPGETIEREITVRVDVVMTPDDGGEVAKQSTDTMTITVHGAEDSGNDDGGGGSNPGGGGGGDDGSSELTISIMASGSAEISE